MNFVKGFVKGLDRILEIAGSYMMVGMVALVTWQVFGRYVLHHIPSWTDEIALMLMMWFGFLSIALGFSHQLHIRISLFIDKLPAWAQRIADIMNDLLIIAFGLLLIIEGYKFSVLTWGSTLPVTKLPVGVQYLVIPLTGLLTMLYGLVWLVNGKERV